MENLPISICCRITCSVILAKPQRTCDHIFLTVCTSFSLWTPAFICSYSINTFFVWRALHVFAIIVIDLAEVATISEYAITEKIFWYTFLRYTMLNFPFTLSTIFTLAAIDWTRIIWQITVLSHKLFRTIATVIIDSIVACTTIVAWVCYTIVDVMFTMGTIKSISTFAGVISIKLLTGSPILACI